MNETNRFSSQTHKTEKKNSVLALYLLCFLGKEQAKNHEIGKWKEKVDVCVIFVLLHKERRPEKFTSSTMT